MTYYLQNQAAVDAYIKRINQLAEEHYQKSLENPPPVVQRLRKLQEERKRQSA